MKTLFGKLFLSFMMVIILIIALLMVSFTLIYSRSFEEQVTDENDKQALYIARSLYSFMHTAYKTVEELSFNSDVLSMDTERQTPVFVSSIARNDYFELLYAQGMDGMQTGRSSGTLGNRKERWWFRQMEQTQKPFISESYYSVGTNMPCASVFFPLTDGAEMIGIMAGDIKLSALHDLVGENADEGAGSWAFILDGKGVVVAHPDSTYQEELYNYRTLTRTVTIKDAAGNPIQDAAGNLTEERSFVIPDAYKAAIEDMMRGNISSTKFKEDEKTVYLSYRPVHMDGVSDPWYVLSVKDGDVAMRTRNTVILLLVVSSVIIITTALLIVFFSARNISSRIKLEAMQAQHEKEKAQASERAKSDFLAMMSHEIRTPMNAIIGIVQIQMQKGGLPDEYAEALEKIHNSGSVLLGIINDILDMSKIEAGKIELAPTEYDVPSLINDTVQLNLVRIGSKPLKFLLDIDKDLPSRLFGDELRLKQIMNNLLSNAIKYTEKGQVKLAVSHTAEGENVLLRLAVADTGQGLRADDKARLFSEYTRFNTNANRATEGTGIGLSITRSLVEMMGGTIEVESEYGKGSVFTVTVRQKAVKCEVIGAEMSARLRDFTFTEKRLFNELQFNRVPMPYGKVLVVDDVDTNLYVAEGLLSPYELQIENANSGYKAIEKVEKGGVYDVIFMDHMMPLMDGIETTRKLREMGYEGAIVALTANAIAGSEEMFRQNGFDGFISKPIDTRQLDAVLHKFVRDRHPEEMAGYQADRYPAEEDKRPAAAESDNLLMTEKLLQIFCRDAQKAVVTLRETAASGNIKLYTTAAHAIKSALANVGEKEASEQAYALEKAGIGENREFIAANTENFIKTLETIIERLRPEENADDAGADPAEDVMYLAEQLRVIELACADYDETAAYAALDRLKEKRWSKERAAALENIRDALFLNSDFERAADLAVELAETLPM